MIKKKILLKEQVCQHCGSKSVIINFTRLLCQRCGKKSPCQYRGDIHKIIPEYKPLGHIDKKYLKTNISHKQIKKREQFIMKKERLRVSPSAYNLIFCPKCDGIMKKHKELYKCKCGFFDSADKLE